jgi:hypothetical protein
LDARINRTFHVRDQCFMFFSRWIAVVMSS